MSERHDARAKRLRWRKHPHSQAEMLRLATNSTKISPHCMPRWVKPEDLIPFYAEALRLTRTTGVSHEVDHFYPLTGETVCGLHVPQNLRVIPAAGNLAKGNRIPEGVETWPPFTLPRHPRKNGRRPTNPDYRSMFPNSLIRRLR